MSLRWRPQSTKEGGQKSFLAFPLLPTSRRLLAGLAFSGRAAILIELAFVALVGDVLPGPAPPWSDSLCKCSCITLYLIRVSLLSILLHVWRGSVSNWYCQALFHCGSFCCRHISCEPTIDAMQAGNGNHENRRDGTDGGNY